MPKSPTEITHYNGPRQLVYCWTDVRRRFVKLFESDGSPIAEEKLRQIALLYQIQTSVKGKDSAERLAARGINILPRMLARSNLAASPALAHPAEIPAHRRHPLHLGTLARPDPLSRGRHSGTRHQPGRKPDLPDRPDKKECILCRA